jgi:CTD kinase subunit beta
LDLLDLYNHHRSATVLGARFPLEAFLTVRIPLNREAEDKQLPRFTHWQEKPSIPDSKVNGSKPGKNANHKEKPQDREKDAAKDLPSANPLTPMSATGEKLITGDRAREGTVRFMLDPKRVQFEKTLVSEYFKVEMEEYEVEED